MVGYHDKRLKTDLELELEASLEEKRPDSGRGIAINANRSDVFKTRQTLQIRNFKKREDFGFVERDKVINSDLEGKFSDIQTGNLITRKLHSQQKRGTRKKILASALKKNKEFKEKTSTIEHVGVVSRGVDSNFQIEGRRLID